MKPVALLRTASVLTVIHSILHTVGGVFGQPSPGPQQTAVAAMKTNTFPVMGLTRSYWDFHLGLGLAVSIFLLMEAVVFWQLGALAQQDSRRIRPLLLTFAAGYIAIAANSYVNFFPPPVITELLIAACLVMAWKKAGEAG